MARHTNCQKNLATKIGGKYLLVSMARRKIEKKKSKSFEPFLIIHLFCTANQTHQWIWTGLAAQVCSSTLRRSMIYCVVMYVIHYFFYIMTLCITNKKPNYLKIYFLFFFVFSLHIRILKILQQTANKGKFYICTLIVRLSAF